MIDRGATTVWETWKKAIIYSNCHPMFGSVSEWFYRWLGGIRPSDSEPGFKKFIISPAVPDEIDFVNCSYHSPFGEIRSDWKKDGYKSIQYHIRVPEGSTAFVDLQPGKIQKAEIIKDGQVLKTIVPKGIKEGRFELNRGEYLITAHL